MAWMPRSGNESYEGVVWLPRLIDKARRYEAFGRKSRLFDGYCYGDNDFVDAKLLKFLRTSDEVVSALVREHADDLDVARALVAQSGHSSQECNAFSARLQTTLGRFFLMEADEGTMEPGPLRSLIAFAYNRLVMPVVYAQFRAAEQNRR